MTNIETKIKEWLQEELESSRQIIAEYTDENRPKCDDGSDDFIEVTTTPPKDYYCKLRSGKINLWRHSNAYISR